MEKKNNCSVLLGYPPFSQDFRLNLSAMIWKMASYFGCRCIWNFSGCNQGTMSWVFIWLSECESSLGTDFSRPLDFGVRFSLWGQNQRDTWLLEKYCQTSNSVALSWISNRMGTSTNYWASWPLGTLCQYHYSHWTPNLVSLQVFTFSALFTQFYMSLINCLCTCTPLRWTWLMMSCLFSV